MDAKYSVGLLLAIGMCLWLFSIWTATLEQGVFLWSSSLTIRALSGVYIVSGLLIGIYRLVLNRQLKFQAAVGVSIISTVPPILFRSNEIFEDYKTISTIFDIDYVIAFYESAVFLVPATTALGIALSRAKTTNERRIGVGMLLFVFLTYNVATINVTSFAFIKYIVGIVILVGGFLLGLPLYYIVNQIDEETLLFENIR